MAGGEIVHRFVARGYRMGDIEFSKEFNVCKLALKAEPVTVIGEDAGTAAKARLVLVLFDALRDDHTLC
jgi:hypothetical protein